MFNKAERARREAARGFHDRRYVMTMRAVESPAMIISHDALSQMNDKARFHRKQAELWAKSVKAFDEAALRTAKLVGRK